MRIGELADRAGTTPKTLRFYEQAGLLPVPQRTPAGYRDYDEGGLDRLRFVKAAQAAGLTLAEIREIIAAREDSGPPCEHVIALLDVHAADLDQRIVELTVLREEVSRLRQRARGLDPKACTADSVCHVIPVSEERLGDLRGIASSGGGGQPGAAGPRRRRRSVTRCRDRRR